MWFGLATILETDTVHLARAVEIAQRGRGRVSPNPMVGAVVVRDGVVLGEGWHRAVGKLHAEREALAACRSVDTAGATMYVSLEPCAHHGRTPPCTDAIVEAGIARVVIASDDPSEHASGRGLGVLRDEGIEVVVADGAIAAEARRLNQPFRKHARTGRPHVLFKSAMTLDGKVATRTGDSKWISGESSRARAHEWRAERDAVIVGIGTALADDPLLTARIDGVERQPRRVVFDSEGRLPLDSQLVRGAPELPLTVVVGRAAPRTATDALEIAGADVIVATGEHEPARIRSALDQLGAAGITSVLLEGGPHLAGAFLDAGEIDQLALFIAPVLLGGSAARDPAGGRGRRAHLGGCARPHPGDGADRRRCADLRANAGVVMFTGLVMDLGEVGAVETTDDGVRLSVRTVLTAEVSPGDSVAINGVCLTATTVGEDTFTADVMHETLDRSSLGAAGQGARVNVELPLRPNDRLGGHVVQGHVDSVGTVARVEVDGFARRVRIEPADPAELRYIVEKGSVAIDGVSLTVASLR